MHDSVESKRLKQLIPSEGFFFENQAEKGALTTLNFPILQPFKVQQSSLDASGIYMDAKLEPWTSSLGGIVVEVRFQDILNSLPGFEDILGEVSIPFSKLVSEGEINGWFQVLEAGTTRLMPGGESSTKNVTLDKSGENKVYYQDEPQIFLSLKWRPPDGSKDLAETEREASLVIQEEFIRSSVIARQNKVDLVGSSIGAINTALGMLFYVVCRALSNFGTSLISFLNF